MNDEQKQELLDLLEDNEYDYWNLPQYAMIPDWFLRYWQLHNKLLVALGEEPYEYPEAAFHHCVNKRNKDLQADG